MKKRILLLRHGKAVKQEEGMPDIERPLMKPGEDAARSAGQALSTKNVIPDLIVSSEATRARATAQAVAETVRYSEDMKTDPTLYAGEPADYLRLIASVADSVGTLLIVGHNPAIEDFVSQAADEKIGMSAGDLFICEADMDRWSDAGGGLRLKIVDIVRA